MFASAVRSQVTIGDVAVTIQKLSWKSLEHAADIQTERALGALAKIGGAAASQQLQNRAETKASLTIEQQREARYRSYDRNAVLKAGVKSWTSAAKLPAALDDLDDDTAELLHRAILDLSLPSLEPGAEEAAQKNA